MRTIIVICKNDRDFKQELREIIRASQECEPEGVSNEQVAEMFTCVINKLDAIEEKEISIMADLQETKAKLDALTTAVDAEHDQAAVVLQEVVDLKAQIATLLAQQGGATPADLDVLNTSIDSILAKVSNIIPDAPVPPPTV